MAITERKKKLKVFIGVHVLFLPTATCKRKWRKLVHEAFSLLYTIRVKSMLRYIANRGMQYNVAAYCVKCHLRSPIFCHMFVRFLFFSFVSQNDRLTLFYSTGKYRAFDSEKKRKEKHVIKWLIFSFKKRYETFLWSADWKKRISSAIHRDNYTRVGFSGYSIRSIYNVYQQLIKKKPIRKKESLFQSVECANHETDSFFPLLCRPRKWEKSAKHAYTLGRVDV